MVKTPETFSQDHQPAPLFDVEKAAQKYFDCEQLTTIQASCWRILTLAHAGMQIVWSEHGLTEEKNLMALVLCTGADPDLAYTRRLILESAGHIVITALDEPTLVAACQRHRFDAAVIGQSCERHLKRRTLELLRQHCPAARVLEVYLPDSGISLSDADDWLESPVMPSELAVRVALLAGEKRKLGQDSRSRNQKLAS